MQQTLLGSSNVFNPHPNKEKTQVSGFGSLQSAALRGGPSVEMLRIAAVLERCSSCAVVPAGERYRWDSG